MATIGSILGNRTRVKILRLLFGTPGRALTPQEIARLAKLGRGNTYATLSGLVQNGVLKTATERSELVKNTGNVKSALYALDPKSPFFTDLHSLFEMESKTITKNWNKINAMEDFIEALEKEDLADGGFSVTLFGSVARGTDTPKSDIDLLVETSEENAKKVMNVAERIGKTHGIPINVTVGRLGTAIKTQNRVLFDNITREGILIYGT